ncbi:MAG: cobyrinate a,c-diamide synthase [Chloroflexi bacterium]|nr:cobyrinate a,c-diamide synthase [Chloroflexota bacterium]
MSVPRVVIGGATSGVGKTTVVIGIVEALSRQGKRVQTFKCGPDYIDPSYHTMASGRPCRSLDTWMLSANAMVELFERAATSVDIAVIEGVMGLYDGRSGQNGAGSTAEIAKTLNAPVILVVDAGKTARSAGAIVLGYKQFDPEVQLSGVILNRISSATHLKEVRHSVESAAGIPVIGYLPKDSGMALPERHLGLVPAAEKDESAGIIGKIGRRIQETVDLEVLMDLAQRAGPPANLPPAGLFPAASVSAATRIAIAQDRAFSFYYEDTLDLLRAWGAELVPVSPLEDPELPPDVGGVYIGGGFPEMFAGELGANESFRRSLAKAATGGLPIYAECGGLMFISEGIVDLEGKQFPMCGLVPGWSKMQKKCVRMGYVAVEALKDSVSARKGWHLRGHEFHWSILEGGGASPAYRKIQPDNSLEGVIAGPQENILGTYLHLHFGSHPDLAPRFVESCAAAKRG